MANKEYCPLEINGNMGHIPDECLRRCERRWAAASGETDIYPARNWDDEDICPHPDSEPTREHLYAKGLNNRRYVVVEECTDCGADIEETVYTFSCPFPIKLD